MSGSGNRSPRPPPDRQPDGPDRPTFMHDGVREEFCRSEYGPYNCVVVPHSPSDTWRHANRDDQNYVHPNTEDYYASPSTNQGGSFHGEYGSNYGFVSPDDGFQPPARVSPRNSPRRRRSPSPRPDGNWGRSPFRDEDPYLQMLPGDEIRGDAALSLNPAQNPSPVPEDVRYDAQLNVGAAPAAPAVSPSSEAFLNTLLSERRDRRNGRSGRMGRGYMLMPYFVPRSHSNAHALRGSDGSRYAGNSRSQNSRGTFSSEDSRASFPAPVDSSMPCDQDLQTAFSSASPVDPFGYDSRTRFPTRSPKSPTSHDERRSSHGSAFGFQTPFPCERFGRNDGCNSSSNVYRDFEQDLPSLPPGASPAVMAHSGEMSRMLTDREIDLQDDRSPGQVFRDAMALSPDPLGVRSLSSHAHTEGRSETVTTPILTWSSSPDEMEFPPGFPHSVDAQLVGRQPGYRNPNFINYVNDHLMENNLTPIPGGFNSDPRQRFTDFVDLAALNPTFGAFNSDPQRSVDSVHLTASTDSDGGDPSQRPNFRDSENEMLLSSRNRSRSRSVETESPMSTSRSRSQDL